MVLLRTVYMRSREKLHALEIRDEPLAKVVSWSGSFVTPKTFSARAPSGSSRALCRSNDCPTTERNSWSRCLASPSALRRALRRRLGSQLQTLLRRARRCSSSSVTFRWNRPRLSDASRLALRCSASAHSIRLPHARPIAHLSLAGACVRRKRRDRLLRSNRPLHFSPASMHHAGPHWPAANQAAAGLHSPLCGVRVCVFRYY